MSLQNKLSLIQHKDYEPIFTGKSIIFFRNLIVF